MADYSSSLNESFSKGSLRLDSLIKDCSTFQASVSSFKHRTALQFKMIKLFNEKKQRSHQNQFKKWIASRAYQDGKALIATKTQVKAGPVVNRQLELAKSLVAIDRVNKAKYDPDQPLAQIKDLSKKEISSLLAINRRKFGESFTSFKPRPPKRAKANFSLDLSMSKASLEPMVKMHRSISFNDRSLHFFEKPPRKTRQILAEEQVQFFNQIEGMSPVNKLVLKETMKFQPALISKLNYRRERLTSLSFGEGNPYLLAGRRVNHTKYQ
jgi:hypothetical protein